MGHSTSNFFWPPPPWDPREGSKGQISFNFNYKIIFKDFYTKLYVFSQMKDLPTPWGPREGSKGQISFNFNYKIKLKDFYTKLCVFSQIKDTKHIRRDFHSVAWVMPQGWDFGALGVPRGSNKIQTWSCGISN